MKLYLPSKSRATAGTGTSPNRHLFKQQIFASRALPTLQAAPIDAILRGGQAAYIFTRPYPCWSLCYAPSLPDRWARANKRLTCAHNLKLIWTWRSQLLGEFGFVRSIKINCKIYEKIEQTSTFPLFLNYIQRCGYTRKMIRCSIIILLHIFLLNIKARISLLFLTKSRCVHVYEKCWNK